MERDESVTILDFRPGPSRGLDAFAPHLDEMGLEADLSSVVTLSPRTPWVDGKGYLDFSWWSDGGWGVYADHDRAEWRGTQTPYFWTLEVWFNNLTPGLYLVGFEVSGWGSFGPGPSQFWLYSYIDQKVDVTGGKQYIGTLIPIGEPGSTLTGVFLRPYNLQELSFYRVSLVNIFG